MARTIRVEAVGGGSRGAGGITGAGGKNVNPLYNESVPPLTGSKTVKVSSNVTVKAPGYKGQMQTYTDLHHNSKYTK